MYILMNHVHVEISENMSINRRMNVISQQRAADIIMSGYHIRQITEEKKDGR